MHITHTDILTTEYAFFSFSEIKIQILEQTHLSWSAFSMTKGAAKEELQHDVTWFDVTYVCNILGRMAHK